MTILHCTVMLFQKLIPYYVKTANKAQLTIDSHITQYKLFSSIKQF